MRLAVNLAPVVLIYGLLASCAWTSHANDVLYPVYHKFVQASRNDDWHTLQDHLLSKRVVMLWQQSQATSLDEFSPIFKNVTLINGKEHSHYEVVNAESACFSVNLITDQASAVTINTGFVLESGEWKVDDVMLDLLESESDFVNTATCPLSAADFLLQAGG